MSLLSPSPTGVDPVAPPGSATTDPARGLDAAEAERRLQVSGPNRLVGAAPRPALLRFLDQFRSFLVVILIGAAVLAAAIGDWKDPIVIGIVVVANAVLGVVQERRAERSLDALRGMLATTAPASRAALA